jgi:hypothetical protein
MKCSVQLLLCGLFLMATMVHLDAVSNAEEAAVGEMHFVSASEYQSMQSRMSDLEKRLGYIQNNKDGCGGKGAKGCFAGDCHSPGISAGGEALFLKAHQSELGSQGLDDYQIGSRIWLGYTAAGGLGLRARWFNYDNSNPNALLNRLDIDSLDLEITDKIALGRKWSGTVGLGVRYTDYNEEWANIFQVSHRGHLGPVIGIELNRCLTDRLSIFTLGRAAYLFGDSRVTQRFSEVPILESIEETTFAIGEMQIGGEWRRPLAGTGYLFARAAVEGQFYTSSSNWDSESLGLVGGTFAIGIDR